MNQIRTKPDSERLSLVHAIKEKVDSGAQRETIETMIQDALRKQKGSLRDRVSRKGEYSVDGEDTRFTRPRLPAELQACADDIYLASKFLRRDPRSLKMWREFSSEASALRKAMEVSCKTKKDLPQRNRNWKMLWGS